MWQRGLGRWVGHVALKMDSFAAMPWIMTSARYLLYTFPQTTSWLCYARHQERQGDLPLVSKSPWLLTIFWFSFRLHREVMCTRATKSYH